MNVHHHVIRRIVTKAGLRLRIQNKATINSGVNYLTCLPLCTVSKASISFLTITILYKLSFFLEEDVTYQFEFRILRR